jgi:hypothetical protein
MDERHASKICHYNSKSGGFGTRHFYSGGFCRKVADSETATFLVVDFISVQYVLGTTYNGHIPSRWSREHIIEVQLMLQNAGAWSQFSPAGVVCSPARVTTGIASSEKYFPI